MNPQEESAVVVREEPGNLLAVIAKAVADPRMDVEKMSRLLDLQERIMADQRKVAFDDAMARLQAKLPQIEKYGKAKNSRYAKYEDVDVIIKPLLIEEHFSLSFNEEARTDQTVTFVLEVSRGGYSKFHRLTVQTDRASKNREGVSIRPAIQDDGSTASYARRYLVKLALNIVEKDEDTDGEARAPITGEQLKDIETIMADVGADKNRFLVYMGVGALKEIRACDYQKALVALEAKRK